MNDKIIEKINAILQTDSLKNIYSNYFKDKLHDKVVKISIVDIVCPSFTNIGPKSSQINRMF